MARTSYGLQLQVVGFFNHVHLHRWLAQIDLEEATDGLAAASRLSEQLDRKEEALQALREEGRWSWLLSFSVCFSPLYHCREKGRVLGQPMTDSLNVSLCQLKENDGFLRSECPSDFLLICSSLKLFASQLQFGLGSRITFIWAKPRPFFFYHVEEIILKLHRNNNNNDWTSEG